MLKKEIIISIIIIIIYTLSCNTIYNQSEKRVIINKDYTHTLPNKLLNNELKDTIKIVQNDNYIGKLIIKDINFENNLYKINSEENNIEENVTILNESIEPIYDNSIMYLAAHSGSGKKAYFKNLNKLSLGSEIALIYNNQKYIYVINKIYEQEKNGYINFIKPNQKTLLLTTCSDNENKQLIIISTIKESI